ncbi:MAG: hypothetical protein Q8M29_06385 [Bacteroidota bacterium]|nr:hypothetical protein [Bacteroidota bacterium]
MNNIVLIFSIVALIASTSCKNKEKAASANSTTSSTNATSNSKTMQSEKKYRLVISYNSIGTGIDRDAYEKMEKFVKEHPNKPAYDRYTYGREGETDIAFFLKEIKSGDQAKFITDLKAAIGKSDRVNYKENDKASGQLRKEIAN